MLGVRLAFDAALCAEVLKLPEHLEVIVLLPGLPRSSGTAGKTPLRAGRDCELESGSRQVKEAKHGKSNRPAQVRV